jgi:steroid delta-isomerase-like uncharacterized protein
MQGADAVSIEEIKAVFRRLIEETFNHGNLAVADDLLATDFVDHAAPSGRPNGIEGFKAAVTGFRHAIPDLVVTVTAEIGEGDRGAARLTMRGTQVEEFFGIPATGKSVTMSGIHIVRFAGGKIAEAWGIDDNLGFFQQLGAIPALPPSEPSSNPPLSREREREPSPSPGVNKAVVHRLIDAFWNAGQAAAFDEVFAPDYVDHDPAPGQPPDREGFRQFAGALRTALPDMHSTVDDLLAEGDRVAWRYSLQATHTGPLLGIPATGKPITMTGMSIDRFAGGQIVERWSQLDTLGLLSQLGAVSVPGFQFAF